MRKFSRSFLLSTILLLPLIGNAFENKLGQIVQITDPALFKTKFAVGSYLELLGAKILKPDEPGEELLELELRLYYTEKDRRAIRLIPSTLAEPFTFTTKYVNSISDIPGIKPVK